jgi:hypothetical protein
MGQIQEFRDLRIKGLKDKTNKLIEKCPNPYGANLGI